MESIAVNWEALDALVTDFAKSEQLIEDAQSPLLSSSTTTFASRLLIRQIRRLLESGEIDSAINLLGVHAPSVLDDHRLLFRLQKQKFIELLRKGTDEDRDSAIHCLRTALAPCALDAYPEAYEEFKHVLLAFIYDKDDQNSPVADEWSERRRFDIAGLLSSVLRSHLQAHDPIFSMTLRYLISIHKGFCLRQGVLSPISDLTERLLLEERDPPAVPQESLYEAPPFNEVDIQALAHAVELTRQGAVDSLRFAKGDLYQAFQNELCRMRLDVSKLDELVHEYCVYRGIVDSGLAYSGNHSVESEHKSSEPLKLYRKPLPYPCDTTNPNEDCSTSGTLQPETVEVVQRNRSHGTGVRNKRKRWRGRHEQKEYSSEILSGSRKHEPSATSLLGNTNLTSEDSSMVEMVTERKDKFEIVLGMKELASQGMAAEVFAEINALDPNFFAQNPILLFQLKQVEFLKLVGLGDDSGALRVASSHLGHLAASNPALLKPLKETLLALLRPKEEALHQNLPLQALATSLQVAIGGRLGIEEPQLMKIIRATLHTHNEWFKLQMCKDHFEGLLRINSLREVGIPVLGDLACNSTVDACTQGSSQTSSSTTQMQEDGSSPTQTSSTDLGCDENAILKVMEFLALPRADAIHLLAQYNGNAETVIQQIFA
ncbi:unnamed protein product [Fraxinus pennsylvanica]|uniref:CTLH domain-containing protein n=1 Tax=Fraxinus pennsylvanica TaxID=56036 RepID=A0AAD1ZA30_9LAMI|nr:unnamed protein product [Fraxinus pennsylvanica]